MTRLQPRALDFSKRLLVVCILLSLVLSSCGRDTSNVAQELNQAKKSYFDGDFDKTIVLCNSALSSDPSNPTAYLFRGNAWAKKGDFDKSIKDLDQLIRLDSQHQMAYLSRAHAWLNKGEADHAIRDCTTAIEIEPNDPAAYISRGFGWRSKERRDEAIEDFTKAIHIYTQDTQANPVDANCAEAYCARGFSLAEKGLYPEADKDFLQALRIDPTGLGPCNGIAWLRATCPDEKYRNGKEAIDFATKACELSSWKISEYLANLAAAYAESGDWEKALTHQEQAIHLTMDEKDKVEGLEILEQYRRKEPYRAKPLATP